MNQGVYNFVRFFNEELEFGTLRLLCANAGSYYFHQFNTESALSLSQCRKVNREHTDQMETQKIQSCAGSDQIRTLQP